MIFTVLIEKEVTTIDKNGEEVAKHISYTLQCKKIMTRSLSNLVNNLSEGIHSIKCKYGHDDKKCELNISVATAFLNIQILKMI